MKSVQVLNENAQVVRIAQDAMAGDIPAADLPFVLTNNRFWLDMQDNMPGPLRSGYVEVANTVVGGWSRARVRLRAEARTNTVVVCGWSGPACATCVGRRVGLCVVGGRGVHLLRGEGWNAGKVPLPNARGQSC